MELEFNKIILAFLLTLIAGLSTGIGSALAFFTKSTNKKFLSVALGLSAGVMIYVSFVEILNKSKELLTTEFGALKGEIFTMLAFFSGIFLIAVIDKFVPSFENPHEIKTVEDMTATSSKFISAHSKTKLMRMGLMSAIAIAIHNFPEGLATFIAALNEPQLGISITIAIAIHNIPEGIAVSVPLYFATNNKKKAFFYSFLSGLAEPLGAVLGFTVLSFFINNAIFGLLFGLVAGIMVFISIDELLPTAREYGEHHLSIYGLIAGMIIMAVSLILF